MATPHSSVATNAILYRGARCRARRRATLENLNADLTQIASRYGRVANVTIPPAVRAHSNAADPCSRIERTPQIMSKLCQLFEVDYACFPSYPRPAACTL